MSPEERGDHVWIERSELEALRARIDELEDLIASRRVEADLAAGSTEALPIEMVDRLFAGESAVRVWREHRGISAAELARRTGMPKSYLSEIETGRKTGSVESLKTLAVALDVTIDDLVG